MMKCVHGKAVAAMGCVAFLIEGAGGCSIDDDGGTSIDATGSRNSIPSPSPSIDDDGGTSIDATPDLEEEGLVIDDIGLLPVTTDTAGALYRVVDAAYEKRSIALSGNLHPAGFDELMPKTIANATVDRLLHHAHIVLT